MDLPTYQLTWVGAGDTCVSKKEEERREEEERTKEVGQLLKTWESLVAEVDKTAEKGDLASVKQHQQLETWGIVIIIITRPWLTFGRLGLDHREGTVLMWRFIRLVLCLSALGND